MIGGTHFFNINITTFPCKPRACECLSLFCRSMCTLQLFTSNLNWHTYYRHTTVESHGHFYACLTRSDGIGRTLYRIGEKRSVVC
jgi:hypothetical protein